MAAPINSVPWWAQSLPWWTGNKLLAELMQKLGRDVYELKQELTEMASRTAAEILAAITANTDFAKSTKLAIDGLREGFTTLTEEIADLKRQIAEGQTPDFTAVDAAIDEQKQVLADTDKAIRANTTAGAPTT